MELGLSGFSFEIFIGELLNTRAIFYCKIETSEKRNTLSFYDVKTEKKESFDIEAANHDGAANFLIK